MNAILLLGLGFVGSRFSKLKEKKDENLRTSAVQQINNPIGDDIYQANDISNAYKDQFRRAYVKKQDSLRTGDTGVVGPEYNHFEKDKKGNIIPLYADQVQDPSDLITHDRVSSLIESQKTTDDVEDFLGAELRITDTLTNEEKFFKETKNDNSYIEHFQPLTFDNPGGPVAINAVPMSTNTLNMLNTERQMGLEQGWSTFNKNKNMTYNVTPAQYFVHNNMVPHFVKGSYGDNSGAYDTVKQRKMELFTGSSNQVDQRHKQELKPFFDPIMGSTNIYGMPTISGNEKDRYTMALKDERKEQSSKPFEPIRVNVGLDLDNYEHGSDGYHPWYRPLDRNVDELRIATKPKISLGNVVIPGMKSQGSRAVQAPVNKNRPETFYEVDPEDILRTYGYIQMPTVRGNYYLPTTLKEQNIVPYAGNPYGVAGQTIDQNMPQSMFPKIKKSDKNEYVQADNQPLYGNHGMSRSNHQIGQNERSTTVFNHPTGLTGHINPLGAGFVVDPHDLPRITTKQQTLYDSAQYNVLDPAGKQIHTYNPNDIQKTTMRQITSFDTGQYAILGPEYQAGMTYNPKDTPRVTIKETTIDKVRSGNIIGNILGITPLMDTPGTTLKQMTLFDNALYSHVAPDVGKTPGFNYNDPLRTTTKQTTLIPVQNGNLSGSVIQNHSDMNHYEAKTTMKEIHELTKQSGFIGGSTLQNKGDMGHYELPTTLKQLTENTIYGGYIGGSNIQNQGGYQYEKFDPKTTFRQIQENSIQGGNVSGSVSQNKGDMNHYEAKITNKQLIEDSIQSGYISNVQNHNANESAKWYCPPTTKQGTSNIFYMGSQGDSLAHTGYQTNKYYAPPTIRQGTTNYLHIGTPVSSVGEHSVYETYYGGTTFDDKKEILALSGRKPTNSNYNKSPNTDMTEYKLRDDTKRIVYRDVMPEAFTANPNQQSLPGCNERERIKAHIPQENQRLDSALLNQLLTCPYAIPLVPNQINCSQEPPSLYGFTGYYNPYSEKQDKAIMLPKRYPIQLVM